jgi:myo-inositol 2-dehydrogenase/D-chiro-inositol 1-dehydrogenase
MSVESSPIRLGLIGAGRMGSFHAITASQRIPGATLAAIADPMPGAARRLADTLNVGHAYEEPEALIADDAVDAVIIAAPARHHAELVVAAAKADKAIFCEKPMAVTLDAADRAVAAAREAGVTLQVGFVRRFAAGYRAAAEQVRAGAVGTPQLLRSITRDPKMPDPERIPPGTIFLETLIHDFDVVRYLNPGARAVEVYAMADALIRPDYKEQGLLDTALVNIRFDNGAMAAVEASFQAVYGYDVRAEVLADRGMLTAGDIRETNCWRYDAAGIFAETSRLDTDLLHDAYVAELREFVACLRSGDAPLAGGDDAREALAIALACIESVQQHRPITI